MWIGYRQNKIAETAKHNTRAAGVAEKQSKLLAETTNTASAASVERLNQAASKREQLLSQSAQKAGAEFGRAMVRAAATFPPVPCRRGICGVAWSNSVAGPQEIAAAAKAEENMNLAEKREALEADMQAANRRAEAAVEQARGKASTEVQRAEQLSSAKKAELAEKRAQLLAKTAAAESRRVSLEEQKMDKMQQQVANARTRTPRWATQRAHASRQVFVERLSSGRVAARLSTANRSGVTSTPRPRPRRTSHCQRSQSPWCAARAYPGTRLHSTRSALDCRASTTLSSRPSRRARPSPRCKRGWRPRR